MAREHRKKVPTITVSEAKRRAEQAFQILIAGVEERDGKPMSSRERQKLSRLLKPGFFKLLARRYTIVPDSK